MATQRLTHLPCQHWLGCQRTSETMLHMALRGSAPGRLPAVFAPQGRRSPAGRSHGGKPSIALQSIMQMYHTQNMNIIDLMSTAFDVHPYVAGTHTPAQINAQMKRLQMMTTSSHVRVAHQTS